MVLRTFNFWGFCGPYRDFHYYLHDDVKFQWTPELEKNFKMLKMQ